MMIYKPSIIGFLDKEFTKNKCIKKIIAEEKLYSKKNKLYKIKCIFSRERETRPAYFVFKLYHGEEREKRKEKEYLMLKALKECPLKSKISVPEVFYKGDNFLITKFVEGDTLLDYILIKEENNEDIRFDKLNPLMVSCEMIKDFYNISKEVTGRFCIFGDVNLRNFIISSKIYRVDFEDWSEGYIEEDFGKFIAFLLTYNPIFSDWKIRLTAKLLKYICKFFYVDKNRLSIEINKEFQSMVKRRNLHPEIFNKIKVSNLFK